MKKVICRSIFVLLAVGGFAALAICIQLGVTQGFDEWVYGWVSQTITPVLTEFLKIITYAGDVFVIIGICVLLLIIPGTRKKVGIPASISVAVAIGLSVMFKHIFSRPRPSVLRLIEETGFSFPSAHAMLSSALYIMLIIMVCKYLKSILAKIVLVPCLSALILVVAYSRVYLGVHYITDIIGGWLIGFAITLIVYTVCRLTFLKR